MRYRFCTAWLAASLAMPLLAADKDNATDIDPDALHVLKKGTDTLKGAHAFSVKVTMGRDTLASNDQMVTYFQVQRITVMHPNKLRVDIDGEHHDVQFLYHGTHATLFEPSAKL